MKIERMEKPLLYSFRRCPYAIRARLALLYADQNYQPHEVSFKNKPAHLLEISPKGTVPVMQLLDGRVIDESIDIVRWALSQQDPHDLLPSAADAEDCWQLIEWNDFEFKPLLDHYKYADRHPEHSELVYRDRAQESLALLEDRLRQHRFLLGATASVADICIMPFIRQFAHVDREWFYASSLSGLQCWLSHWLETAEFKHVMKKQ